MKKLLMSALLNQIIFVAFNNYASTLPSACLLFWPYLDTWKHLHVAQGPQESWSINAVSKFHTIIKKCAATNDDHIKVKGRLGCTRSRWLAPCRSPSWCLRFHQRPCECASGKKLQKERNKDMNKRKKLAVKKKKTKLFNQATAP